MKQLNNQQYNYLAALGAESLAKELAKGILDIQGFGFADRHRYAAAEIRKLLANEAEQREAGYLNIAAMEHATIAFEQEILDSL